MATVHPIRQTIMQIAAKIVGGDEITEFERRSLEGIRTAFPDAHDPVHVYCADHKFEGTLLYDAQTDALEATSVSRDDRNNFVCTRCRDGRKISVDVVCVL